MLYVEAIALAAALFGSGAALGIALLKLLARPSRDLGTELAGWLACERAAYEESEFSQRERLIWRIGTRVPPRLRLLYEEASEGSRAHLSAKLS